MRLVNATVTEGSAFLRRSSSKLQLALKDRRYGRSTMPRARWTSFSPPNADVDAYRLGWIGDYVDAMDFLELWTCDSGNNNSNFCDPAYDRLVAQARRTSDNQQRYELYAQLEERLVGPEGALSMIPIYRYTYTAPEKESVKDTVNLNLLDQVDLTKVQVVE